MRDARAKLPSLDLLRGFEAAARNLSFTRAAAELYLTQSAVSRQVKAIEDQLGVALFLRRHRALALTEAGQELYRATTQALGQLAAAAAAIRERKTGRTLTVTATFGFSSLWLIPRLADFRGRRPDIDIRIAAENKMLDLEREGVEVAVRYCLPKDVPRGAIKLFGDSVLPVCSPRAVTRSAPLARPDDLRHHVLLHYEPPDGATPWLSWTVWIEVMRLQGLKPAGALRFSQYDQTIRAAIDGQGVALGTMPLVKQSIRQGKLIAPFAREFESSRAYFLLVSPAAAGRPEVQEFANWLLGEAKCERSSGKPGVRRATSRSRVQ